MGSIFSGHFSLATLPVYSRCANDLDLLSSHLISQQSSEASGVSFLTLLMGLIVVLSIEFQGSSDIFGRIWLLSLWFFFIPLALETRLSQGSLPDVTKQDLAGSADAILRVQRVFKLSTPELGNGLVRSRSAAPMTLGDLEYLGLRALEVRDYGLMVEWMEEALSRTSADDTETRARLLFYIARGHYFVRTYQNIKCCGFELHGIIRTLSSQPGCTPGWHNISTSMFYKFQLLESSLIKTAQTYIEYARQHVVQHTLQLYIIYHCRLATLIKRFRYYKIHWSWVSKGDIVTQL